MERRSLFIVTALLDPAKLVKTVNEIGACKRECQRDRNEFFVDFQSRFHLA